MNNELWDKIENTGEWWLDPWWEKRNWLGAERYPLEQLQESAEILKELFPAEWAKEHFSKKPEPNKVLAILIGHNAGALGALHHLGQAAKRLREKAGFLAILERLRNDDSESAYLELEMADIFAEKALSLEFPRPTSEKTPDIVVHFHDTTVEIECKRLKTEDWETWHDKLTNSILFEVGQLTHRDDFDLQIELNNRISEIFLSDQKCPGFNQAIVQGIATQIKLTVAKILRGSRLPVEFAIPDLMVGRALHKPAEGGSYIRGAEISGVAKFRRIITNGMLRGLTQLSGKVPGLLCIYSDYLPSPELARTVLDALTVGSSVELRHRFEPMSALILYPMSTIFMRNAPYLLENKSARTPFSDLEASAVVKSALAPIIA